LLKRSVVRRVRYEESCRSQPLRILLLFLVEFVIEELVFVELVAN